MSDAVNKPAHYNQGSIECIDAMKIVLTQEEFRGYLKGNVFKYLWREKDKNGNEDIRKGKSYYDSLIELIDASEAEQLATGEVAGEGTGEVKPPEGWRWLEVGEVIREGDLPWEDGCVYATEPIMLGMALPKHWKPMIRRNKFEVGEKVVYTIDNTTWTFKNEINDGPRFPKSAWVTRVTGIGKMSQRTCVNHLAPCIKDAKPTTEVAVEVTGEVKNPLGCPDGWRWIEVGETLRRGDTTNTIDEIPETCIDTKCVVKHFALRRNRFEVGEKVVHINGIHACVVVECDHEKDQYVIVYNGRKYVYESKCLVPYIEEAK